MPPKRKTGPENGPTFIYETPGTRKRAKRRVFEPLTTEQLHQRQAELQLEREQKSASNAHVHAEEKQIQEDKVQQNTAARIQRIVAGMKDEGIHTLHEFLVSLFSTRDQHLARHVSHLLGTHGFKILDAMRTRRPDIVVPWAIDEVVDIIRSEGRKLRDLLQPDHKKPIAQRLNEFSLNQKLEQATELAPTTVRLLREIGNSERKEPSSPENRSRRNVDLVSIHLKQGPASSVL
ncbi:hypothetical protein PUNSTDRAFT_130382 [Punctularia strigosozonata HHB-11173 SS5]|uniref:uncharacterized protein n=1 Tax=Punctularia strigosozonata (strain HHB-11173) TaxID=741275 RepID=UPI00044169F1|nr:uncharacterized protein PUNSTDRAFT_130382 [Punctularia strigosozonata HHB-11173 SS5]EIN14750.1 hypothetical protein PUNSTDRAFT_130382 [Punctularia strigosozonata HHB-11173 SS5]